MTKYIHGKVFLLKEDLRDILVGVLRLLATTLQPCLRFVPRITLFFSTKSGLLCKICKWFLTSDEPIDRYRLLFLLIPILYHSTLQSLFNCILLRYNHSKDFYQGKFIKLLLLFQILSSVESTI